MIQLDTVNKIRKEYSLGRSINAIAKLFNRSWETIQRLVTMSREELKNRGKRPKRKSKVIDDKVVKAVEAYILEEINKKVPRKQRYTAKKIYNDLKERGIYKGSLRVMQDLVKSLRIKHKQTKKKVFLPLEFDPGTIVQVDHGQIECLINGVKQIWYLFLASVPGEGLRFCQVYPTKASVAWGLFHEELFSFFGGVFPTVAYDNDSVLVKKVLGSERHQTTFCFSLEEHYRFECHFCNVGAGNEKGSVENGVGYCRRNFLAGLPNLSNWNTFNKSLKDKCLEDIKTLKHYKTKESLITKFNEIKKLLKPCQLPKRWKKPIECPVNSYQYINTDNHFYSVPEKYVGSNLSVHQFTFEIEIFDNDDLVVSHERKYLPGDDSLILDHYLDQLKFKASAFWDCRATRQHKFEPKVLEMWDMLEVRYPPREAKKKLIEILLLKRSYPLKQVIEAIDLAISYKAIDSAAVESILKGLNTAKLTCSETELKEHLKEEHVLKISFDLSQYKELCEGGKND